MNVPLWFYVLVLYETELLINGIVTEENGTDSVLASGARKDFASQSEKTQHELIVFQFEIEFRYIKVI